MVVLDTAATPPAVAGRRIVREHETRHGNQCNRNQSLEHVQFSGLKVMEQVRLDRDNRPSRLSGLKQVMCPAATVIQVLPEGTPVGSPRDVPCFASS